jgi:hypothetical protein
MNSDEFESDECVNTQKPVRRLIYCSTPKWVSTHLSRVGCILCAFAANASAQKDKWFHFYQLDRWPWLGRIHLRHAFSLLLCASCSTLICLVIADETFGTFCRLPIAKGRECGHAPARIRTSRYIPSVKLFWLPPTQWSRSVCRRKVFLCRVHSRHTYIRNFLDWNIIFLSFGGIFVYPARWNFELMTFTH